MQDMFDTEEKQETKEHEAKEQTEFEFVTVPNFNLSAEEQKELLDELASKITSAKTENEEHYKKINKIRDYKNCKNSTQDRIKKFTSADDTDNSSPNVHLPDLKNNGNIGASEIKDAIFTADFLEWKASDPSYSADEEIIKKVFNSIREQTNTDYTEMKIVDNIWYEGTCPVIIKNDGRMNAHHEIMYKSEVALTPENIQLISTYLIEKIGVDPIGATLIFQKVKPVLYYKNTLNLDDEIVTEIYLENEFIIDIVEEDEEFMKTEAILTQQFGIDLSKVKTKSDGIKTTETWIEGMPKPEILNFINTFIEPYEANHNPDTYTVAYEMPAKTINLFDNPNFMNREKLKGNDNKFIGSTTVKKDGDNDGATQTVKDPVCTFQSGYFDSYKFTCGEQRVLRNFIVSGTKEGGGEDKGGILLECKPNMSYAKVNNQKISRNPYLIFTYYETTTSNLGSCPALDILDLTKINNILYNYGLETLSTVGNKYIMDGSVDFQTMGGGVGTLFMVDLLSSRMKNSNITDVSKLVKELPTDASVVQLAMSQSPMMRDYMNQLSNTSQSYFQSKTQQTATEISTVANQASGIVKTVIVQLAKKLCDMYSRMWEDAVNKGITIEIIVTEKGEDGADVEIFKKIDLSEYKNKKFTPIITSITPNLSRQLIANKLVEMLQMALSSQNPEVLARFNISEVVEYILDSYGIDQPNLTRDDNEAKAYLLETNEKEQMYEQIKSGKYQIVEAMPQGEAGQGADGLPSDSINPVPQG